MGFSTKDILMGVTGKPKAAGTAGTAYSSSMDLKLISDEIGVRTEPFELELYVPAFTTTHLPTGTTAAFKLESSNDSTFTSGVVTFELPDFSVTGGTAASAKKQRFRLSLNAGRYVRIACTTTATGEGVATGTGIGDLVFGIDYYC